MTEPGALALTGGVLLMLALACAFIADENSHDNQPYAGIAWTLFVAAAGCFIGAAWWQVIA